MPNFSKGPGFTIALSTGMTPKSTGTKYHLSAAYSKFSLACQKATSVATSAFTVKLLGALTTSSTAPVTLVTCTSANRIKVSTGGVPVSYVWFSCTKFTTAAGRKLRIDAGVVP